MKNKNKMSIKYMYISIEQHSYLNCDLAPLTCDVTCWKLQRYRGNIGDKKLSVEDTSLLVAICLFTLGWIFFATNISYQYFTQHVAQFEKMWSNL